MWNKEIKGRRLKTEDLSFLSFLSISIGLLLAIAALISISEFGVIILSIPLIFLGIGILVLFMKKGYRDKYFPDRRFSQPVSPNGSPLEDNSEELKKQISEENRKNKPVTLRDTWLGSIGLLAASILLALLDTRLFSQYPESNWFATELAFGFIGTSGFVGLLVFRKKDGRKLRLWELLLLLLLVPLLIAVIMLMFQYSRKELLSYLSAGLAIFLSGLIIHRVRKINDSKSDE